MKLVKYWLEVSNDEQARRFEARIQNPLRQWKLSPVDLPSRERWYAYSRARDEMFEATDTKYAPWNIVRSDDKKRARLNCITHLLDQINYKQLRPKKFKLPARCEEGRLQRHGFTQRTALYSRSLFIDLSSTRTAPATRQTGQVTCRRAFAFAFSMNCMAHFRSARSLEAR